MTMRRHVDGRRPPERSRLWRSAEPPMRCSWPFAWRQHRQVIIMSKRCGLQTQENCFMTNQKHNTSMDYQRDRLSFLWLALGIVLLPFSMPMWTIILAAWLAPVFLLRFVRTQPLLRGMLLVLLANVLVYTVKVFVMFPSAGAISDLVNAFSLGVSITLPYLLDRLLARRLSGLPGALVFPLAVTSVWYLLALNPEGTLLNPAYSQYGDLPLL